MEPYELYHTTAKARAMFNHLHHLLALFLFLTFSLMVTPVYAQQAEPETPTAASPAEADSLAETVSHFDESESQTDFGATNQPVEPTARSEFRYGVGFQSTFPAWGISGMMTINETMAAQAILGFLGNLNTIAGRGLYTFREEQHWDAYGYGMLGYWSYGAAGISRESAIGFGVGAGFQYDWRAFDDGLPPIFWNLEVGLGVVNLDNYNFSSMMFGTGLHYRF